ncbi:MAG TPA: response regulator transcription factor [Anaerolineaceae bacterium]|jgi:DNA-binding response OmpR family regulator|nr:response regulator transcription factor [Anaerolineaceae bacterium]
MPNRAKILLVEGKRSDRPSLVTGLTKKGFNVETAPNGSAALARIKEAHAHLIIVDAASMRTSGKRIITSLRQHAPSLPLVLIVDEQIDPVDKQGADVLLVAPFTLQKLLNRIKPLLPAEQKDTLQIGPLELDVRHRWVRCHERQSRLTPRLVALLKALMERTGQVIPREELFTQVWETNYAGDMRTLDVHISWLRQAIEDDPRRPRYLKTLRGMGYRLDVDDNDG